MTSAATISDEKFLGLVETMLKVGGAWHLSLSKDGCWMTYAGETHRITTKHAEVMFDNIPRKCS